MNYYDFFLLTKREKKMIRDKVGIESAEIRVIK